MCLVLLRKIIIEYFQFQLRIYLKEYIIPCRDTLRGVHFLGGLREFSSIMTQPNLTLLSDVWSYIGVVKKTMFSLVSLKKPCEIPVACLPKHAQV